MTDDRSTPAGSPDPDDAGPDGAGRDDPGQDHVSELLAAAAAEERLPAEVAARLDSVLADLVAERTDASGTTTAHPAETHPETAPGVPSLAARRRRRWPGLLVAAAAVSVLGLGVGNLLGSQGGGAGDAMTADSSAGGAAESAEDPDVSSLRAEQDAGVPTPGTAATDTAAVRPPRLRTATLAADVRRVVDLVPVERRLLTGEEEAASWCVRPTVSPGDEALPVRLDGRRAVLVLREPAGDRRTADVFTCDDGDTPAATTTVPAP
ncbi:MAG TPA: hypothetical protein VFZ64_12910 [Nocardioidaceae bacterium]